MFLHAAEAEKILALSFSAFDEIVEAFIFSALVANIKSKDLRFTPVLSSASSIPPFLKGILFYFFELFFRSAAAEIYFVEVYADHNTLFDVCFILRLTRFRVLLVTKIV